MTGVQTCALPIFRLMLPTFGPLPFLLQFFLIIYTGTSIDKRWLRIVHLMFSLVFLAGVLMKIMHWPYAQQILDGGILFVFLITGHNYIRKKRRERIDFLLVIWLSLMTFLYLSVHSEIPGREYLLLMSSILFWVNLIYIIYLKSKKRKRLSL